MREDVAKSAAKSVGAVFILSLVASLGGFACEALFAKYFGVSSQTDAFAVAYQIPTILFSVLTVSISTTVVPLYSRARSEEDPRAAKRFASRFTTLILVLSTVGALGGVLLAPWIVKLFSPGLPPETNAFAVKFTRILFPTTIFTSLMSVFSGVLQTRKKFVKSSVLTIIRQGAYAAALWGLRRALGIDAALYGLLFATVLEFLVSWRFTVAEEKIRLDFCFKDEKLLRAAKMSVPIFLGIGAAELNRLVSQVVASFFETGSITALNYASRLSGAFSGLIIGSISTVTFPLFAGFAAKNDKEGLSKIFFLTMNAYLFLTIPVVVGGFILRRELVAIAFLRGAFTQENVEVVSGLFAGCVFSTLFAALRQTGAKLFYAEGDTKTPMTNGVVGFGVNIVLNIVLGRYFGAAGLVGATTISTALVAVLLLRAANRYLDAPMWRGFAKAFVKASVAAGGMGLVLSTILPIVGNFGRSAATLGAVFFGAAIYAGFLFLLRTEEVKEFLETARRKKRAPRPG